MTITVAIYVFPRVEVLDFTGPFEVFTTASRVHGRLHRDTELPFRVWTVARSEKPVRARAGLRVLPDYTLHDCPQADVLIIPGGVVEAEVNDAEFVRWVANRSRAASIVASVCTGAFVLAQAGLLSGKVATTHWQDLEEFRRTFPSVEVRSDVRWVDQGKVITSAGIAAGIDMSFHVIRRLAGSALAEATARQMDVPYRCEA